MIGFIRKWLFAPYWTTTKLKHKQHAKIGCYPNQRNTAWKADIGDIKKCMKGDE